MKDGIFHDHVGRSLRRLGHHRLMSASQAKSMRATLVSTLRPTRSPPGATPAIKCGAAAPLLHAGRHAAHSFASGAALAGK